MTTQPTNEPIPPFRVQSELLKEKSNSSINGSASRPPFAGNGGWGEWRPFREFDWTLTQVLAGPLLAVIYFLTQARPDFGPVTVLVLLGAVMHRLDEQRRRIAAVPITLAALRLASNLVTACSPMARYVANYPGRPTGIPIGATGIPWLPLFFAICLIYMPKNPTATGKIFLATSTLLLASGLLPVEGALGIFATCQYLLFVGVVIGLILDFTAQHPAQPHPSVPGPAAPLGAAPLGATR
jgi:hypothetical protein